MIGVSEAVNAPQNINRVKGNSATIIIAIVEHRHIYHDLFLILAFGQYARRRYPFIATLLYLTQAVESVTINPVVAVPQPGGY